MKQDFCAGRHHLTTVFPVVSSASAVSSAPVVVSLSPGQRPSEAAEEDRDEGEDDDTSSLEDQASNHSGSSSSRTVGGAGGPQAMFLNFTSDLEPHTKPSSKPKKAPAFRVNGVNILNRKNVDSKTAIERIQRRRENHNHVERRRRDNINNTILELSRIIPNAGQAQQKLNKGNVLKLALDYIHDLQKQNQKLRETNQQLGRRTEEADSRCRTDLLTHPEKSPSHIPEVSCGSSTTPGSPEATGCAVRPTPHSQQILPSTVIHSSSSLKHPHTPRHHHQERPASLSPLRL